MTKQQKLSAIVMLKLLVFLIWGLFRVLGRRGLFGASFRNVFEPKGPEPSEGVV